MLPAVGFYICSIGPALRSLPSTSGANFLVPADSSNGGGGRDERRVAELLLDRLDRLEQEKKSSVDAAAAGYIPDVPVLDTAPKSLPLEDPGPTSNEPEWLGRLRNGFGSTANSRQVLFLVCINLMFCFLFVWLVSPPQHICSHIHPAPYSLAVSSGLSARTKLYSRLLLTL